MLPALINHYSVATEDTNSEIFELLKHLRLHVLISLNPDGHWMSREAASTNPKGMFSTFFSFWHRYLAQQMKNAKRLCLLAMWT